MEHRKAEERGHGPWCSLWSGGSVKVTRWVMTEIEETVTTGSGRMERNWRFWCWVFLLRRQEWVGGGRVEEGGRGALGLCGGSDEGVKGDGSDGDRRNGGERVGESADS